MTSTLGTQIDSRGITLDLDEGDFITDIIVIAECVTEDGEKFLTVSRDDHTNWLKELGMLSVALKKVQDDQ